MNIQIIMELKEFANHTEDDYFSQYLSTPTTEHGHDRLKFLKYAIAANYNGSSFSSERKKSLRDRGVSDSDICILDEVFSWIGTLVEAMR